MPHVTDGEHAGHAGFECERRSIQWPPLRNHVSPGEYEAPTVSFEDLMQPIGPWFRPEDIPVDYGVSLPMVYLVWTGVVLILYPPCRWFAGVKSRHSNWWLSYL